MKCLFFTFLTMLFITSFAFSATINVPFDYATIQEAIDASSNGDHILVAPNTYNERINFLGKAITVQSTLGPLVTTIDGGNIGPVVLFNNNDTSVLDGFTITNGYVGGAGSGAGIKISKSSPTVKNNIITGNTANMGAGGIEVITNSGTTANPKITDNIISSNTGYLGAAICCSRSNMTLSRNIIKQNQATIHGNIIQVYENCNVYSDNNIICDNEVLTEAFAAFRIYGSNWYSINDTFVNNIAPEGSTGGYGLEVSGLPTKAPIGNLSLINSIIWNNGDQEEIHVFQQGNTTVLGRAENVNIQIPASTGPMQWYGVNINSDPLFKNQANMDYKLTVNSPCIDAGQNSAVAGWMKNFEYGPRKSDPQGGDTPIVDIGADEFLTLSANSYKLSESQGGVIDFSLYAGASSANCNYMILGSVSGYQPGITMPGGLVLPINWDNFTNLVISFMNSPLFPAFEGQLNSNGANNTAQMNTQGPLPPNSIGTKFYYAFAVCNPGTNIVHFVSNAVEIEVVN